MYTSKYNQLTFKHIYIRFCDWNNTSRIWILLNLKNNFTLIANSLDVRLRIEIVARPFTTKFWLIFNSCPSYNGTIFGSGSLTISFCKK